MSNPTVRYVRRAIEEARNKGGMLAGMPKVTINMADAEGLCIIADQVERLQARVAELEYAVKIFRDCINTQFMPGQGSRCYKIAYDLVGEPDDDGGDA